MSEWVGEYNGEMGRWVDGQVGECVDAFIGGQGLDLDTGQEENVMESV